MSASTSTAAAFGSANPPSSDSPIKRKALALSTMVGYAFTLLGIKRLLGSYVGHDIYLHGFAWLFVWRYARFFVSVLGWLSYRPAPVRANPRYTPNKDVSVILPTIDPMGDDFAECITTCAANSPRAIFIITAGDELLRQTKAVVEPYIEQFPDVEFTVSRTNVASKREQVAKAIPQIKTAIAVMLDDHVFWKPDFLTGLLAPFEDPNIGMVGTNKAVRRVPNLTPWRRIWNMIGSVYLLRHNFEIRSTNAVDGGVFVVSGRTAAIRTAIIQDPVYMAGYTNELFFFRQFGPLNADDDNYTTRFLVTRGWKIKIQYTPETEITTTVGVADPVMGKFLGQCRRWVRTTWRSNSCSLFTDGSVWSQQPWCVYSVYFTSFTNFALFTDGALLYLISKSSFAQYWWAVALWIIFTKAVKVSAYFWQHPQDLWTFPAYLAFAYFHSLIKLWALLTFWDCSWSGRDFTKIDAQARGDADSDSDEPSSAPAQRFANIHKGLARIKTAQAIIASDQDSMEDLIQSVRGELKELLCINTNQIEQDLRNCNDIRTANEMADELDGSKPDKARKALRDLEKKISTMASAC